MLKHFSLFGFVYAFIFVVSCNITQSNNSGLNDDTVVATILSPTDNQEYDPYNVIFIILEYDTTKWLPEEGFVWEYSKDQGKTWGKIIEMSSYDNNQTQLPRSQNNKFKYDVRLWKPVLNGLEGNIDIWFKASAYGGTVSVKKEGIKIRKLK
jgi:hypothetical protein